MVWGWYQVDAKFRPELRVVELLLQFESKSPTSLPSYKANFVLNWTPATTEAGGEAPSVSAGAADEKLQQGIARGALPPPPGDWLVLAEAQPRWRGSLVGGGCMRGAKQRREGIPGRRWVRVRGWTQRCLCCGHKGQVWRLQAGAQGHAAGCRG